MRTIGLVALLVAACGTRHPRITITVAADGTVAANRKSLTLDELGAFLATRREAGPKEQAGHCVEASALPVLLEPAADAHWAHMSWVIAVLAEQGFWRLSFPDGRDAPLQADCACAIIEPPDGVALLLRVLIREDGGYAFGARTTRDIGELGTWIDEAPREGFACRIGVIRGQPRATWRDVRAAFDLLRAKGAGRILFDGALVAARGERARSPLPAPRSDTSPARWGGIAAAGYWTGTGCFEEEEPEIPEEYGLLAAIDARRLRAGLPRPELDLALTDAARLHAEEMDRLGYFGHFSPVPENRSPSDRLAKAGWPVERPHAELLAKAGTADAAFEAILAKPESAAVLADATYTRVGVARSGDLWVVIVGADG